MSRARPEDLLAEWPVAEPDEAGWEARAQAIVARATPGVAPDGLLDAPALVAEPGEPSEIAAPQAERAGLSLAALARAHLDSGEVQKSGPDLLAALSQRGSSPSIVPAASSVDTARVPPSVDVGGGPPSRASLTSIGERRRSRAALIGAVSTALAAAAAAGIWLSRAPAPAPLTGNAESSAAAAHVAAAVAPSAGTASQAIALEALPMATGQQGSPGAAGGGALAAHAKPAGSTAPAETIALADEPPPAAKPTGPGEPPPDPELTPSEKREMPLEPAPGAVQASVASVLGGARACVAGQTGSSRASITFGSNGRVKSVSVESGTAVGTPAATCIVSALSRARVEPFAKASFTVGVTVRP